MRRNSDKQQAKVLSICKPFRGRIFDVTREVVCEPGGYRALREVVRHPGSVVFLATARRADKLQVLLERQYRHAAGDFMWELPAGKIDHGERPLSAAKRELREETGYTSMHWRRILRFYVSPGFLTETMTIYTAEDIMPGPAKPEADEMIESRFFTLHQALRMCDSGAIRDAKTIVPIYWFALDRLQNKP